MPSQGSNLKVGVYVDVTNIYRNGGNRMRYEVLREFAARDAAELVRLNAYVSFDEERAGQDPEYRARTNNFYSTLRDYGYKVIKKTVRWYQDETGKFYGKANADLDLAVDALLQSENLDRMLIATGDGDFIQVVRALQNKGCRVEIVAFDNVSSELRYEADMFFSGYLIPNLIPPLHESERSAGANWGEEGSRVRGVCYWHHKDQPYGFMRFLKRIDSGLWLTDTRLPNSPYESAYFPDSNLPREINLSMVPSRDYFFEFTLSKSSRQEGWIAIDIDLVTQL
ncbi:MAG: NYN domain-containing protein [bacterium]